MKLTATVKAASPGSGTPTGTWTRFRPRSDGERSCRSSEFSIIGLRRRPVSICDWADRSIPPTGATSARLTPRFSRVTCAPCDHFTFAHPNRTITLLARITRLVKWEFGAGRAICPPFTDLRVRVAPADVAR